MREPTPFETVMAVAVRATLAGTFLTAIALFGWWVLVPMAAVLVCYWLLVLIRTDRIIDQRVDEAVGALTHLNEVLGRKRANP